MLCQDAFRDVGEHGRGLQDFIQVFLPAKSAFQWIKTCYGSRISHTSTPEWMWEGHSHASAPVDDLVLVACDLETLALFLVSHKRDVGQPLLACNENQAVAVECTGNQF